MPISSTGRNVAGIVSGSRSRTRARYASAISTSVRSGRCGPCCSVAASGSTAIHRAASVLATSAQAIADQSRAGMVARGISLHRFAGYKARVAHHGQNDRRSAMMRGSVLCRALMAVLALAAAPRGATAQTLDKVSFGTNWVAEAEHGGFFQAVADGTYKAYGLDVTIVPGGPNVNNRALLLAGRLDFFMSANTLQSLDAVANNVPVVAIAAMFQKDPQVLLAHPEAKVTKLEDLRPLTLFVSKEGVASYFQWLKSEYGFSEDKIKPYTFNAQPFLADSKSAIQVFIPADPYLFGKQAGFKPAVILLADYGFNTYSTLIETRRDLTESKPDLVQRFVDASIVGWYNYLYGDSKAANAMIKKLNPEMTDDLLNYSVQTMKQNGIVDSGDSLKDGIGAMSDERMASFFDKMVRAGVVKRDIDFRKAYTLRFINKGVGLNLRPKN